MKSHSFLRSALLSAGFLTLGTTASFGQAAAAAPAAPAAQGAAAAAGGRGGGVAGTYGIARPMKPGGLPEDAIQPPVLSDLEVTEITRIRLATLAPATKAVTDARTELTKATFAVPANAQNLTAKVQALTNAELALATGRADALAAASKGYKELTPEKRTAIIRALGGTVAGGGRGGN